MSRGILCIGTGAYSALIPSLQKNLAEREAADVLFCLTDDPALLASPDGRVGSLRRLHLPWGSLRWPWPTLFRYHAMTTYAETIRRHASHLVYCDVDMRVVDDTSALFSDRVTAVAHPGQWAQPRDLFPLEQNPLSTAHVARGAADRYVAGGVQGGPVAAYLRAAEECARAVEQDHLRGITAVWHDESHWNRYVHSHPEVNVLGPEFCWPESWSPPADLPAPRVLALDKAHHALRGTSATPLERVQQALRHPALRPARARVGRVLGRG